MGQLVEECSDGRKLADEHWSYIERVLREHSVHTLTIKTVKFHYISAFIHGYKHGVESCDGV